MPPKTILLVCTGYSPHEHLLDLLGMMAARHDPSLASIFPRETAEQRHRFEALDYAYIGARYDVDFRIAPEDLTDLAACVRTLLARTKSICAEALKP